MRKSAIRTACLSFFLCSAGASSALRAQEAWPQKRISFTVAFSAGGFADTVARIMATKLQQRLGQPIVVQNLDGAAGNTAARRIANSEPDG